MNPIWPATLKLFSTLSLAIFTLFVKKRQVKRRKAKGLVGQRSMFSRAVASRVVRFTKRQLMWHTYNKMYKKINCLDNLKEKQRLRRKTKKLRDEILITPNYFVTTIFISKII